ncbi:uncharacterized protein [Littorina saxatilis]|uniref:Uncharacterized protein n=1 Tax=Littorina saxatilis TaxID=31220 RepID=A0AAN9G6S3_9CAEN
MKFCVLTLLLFLSHHRTQAATTAPPPPPPTPPPSTAAGSNPNNLPSNTIPASTATNNPRSLGPGGPSRGPQPPQEPSQLPVWAECLAKEPKDAPTNSSVASLFRHWCSNYNTVIPCVEAGLPTKAAQNPLDLFVKLHFDAELVRTRSVQLCQAFQGVSDRLQCVDQNNGSMEAWCKGRFSQGLQYVFAVQLQQAFNNDANIYRQLACQVTEDTSGCLGAAMTTCDNEVKQHVLAYYGLFTNDTCLADPSEPYTTPAPPPTQQPPPRDVVITCAQRVAQTVPQATPLADNSTQLDQLVYGLRQNCRSFEARYNCYDEELDRITNPTFRDVWLSFTFDSTNAIKSQKEFCQAFEGGVVGSLTDECYNKTQPRLRQCEDLYGQDVVTIQRQWAQSQLDNVGVHQAACRTSMRRAFCLRDAFRLCGTPLAESMLASELGTLPDICFTLRETNNSNDTSSTSSTTTGGQGSSSSASSSSSSTTGIRSSGQSREPIPAAETTDEDLHHTTTGGGRSTSLSTRGQSSTSRAARPTSASSLPSNTQARDRKTSPPSGVSATVGQSTGDNGSSAPAMTSAVCSVGLLALLSLLYSFLV